MGRSSLGCASPAAPDQLGQRGERVVVELAHARGLVGDHERALAPWILRRDAGRATVGVAGLRLDAAEREHEAARRVAPVGAERQQRAPYRSR